MVQERLESGIGRTSGLVAVLLGWYREERKDLTEGLASLLICTFGDIIAGTFIGLATDKISLLPALLILIPPTIGMRGNIYSSLGSRLGSYLHTGQIKPIFESNKIMNNNILATSALTLITAFYLGILSAAVGNLMGFDVTYSSMILISVLAAGMSVIFMLPATISLSILTYKKGYDPDNFTAPIITFVGDFITLPLLFLSTDLVFSMEDDLSGHIVLVLFIFSVLISLLSYLWNGERLSRRIMVESTPILLITGLFGLLAGVFLTGEVENLISIAGLFTLVPPFLEDGGAIGGILSARLSSKLHMGVMRMEKLPSYEVLKSFITMHILGFIIFPLIGIFAFLINAQLGLESPSLPVMAGVTFIAGQVMVAVVNFLSYYSSIFSFRFGLDPDNIVIPLITSFMDVAGTVILISVVMGFGIIQ